jgi:O-antigen ligase
VAVAFAAASGVAALLSPQAAALVLFTATGLVALAGLAAFLRSRLVDVLFVLFVALTTVPIDKYFLYQAQVGGWPGLRISIADLVMLPLAVVCVLAWIVGRTRNAVPTTVIALYALLVVQYVLSMVGARETTMSMFEVVGALHALAICVLVAALFRREYLAPVVVAIAVQVVVHSGFAIAQIATGEPVGSGWINGAARVMQEQLTTGEVRLRPSGLFDHPNIFANFLVISLPLLAAAVLMPARRALHAAAAFALFAGLTSLVLTLARGAWIASVVGAFVFVVLAVRAGDLGARRLGRVLGWTTTIGVPIGLLFLPAITARLLASNAGNVEVRLELNRIALSMIEAHPVAGVGINNFLPTMPSFDPHNVMRIFPAAVHNVYLLEAAEAGIPALVLFVAIFTTVISVAVRRLPSMRDVRMRWTVVALATAVVSVLVTQMADFSLRLEPLRSCMWMNVGLLFGALRQGSRLPAPRGTAPQ